MTHPRVWLGRCFLSVYILLVLGATLRPSDPVGSLEWSQVLCLLCGRAAMADALANLALFLPLGGALALLALSPRRALFVAAGLSLSVELAQFAIPGRDPSLSDFIFNTVGAAVGGGVVRLFSRCTSPEVRVASRLSLLVAVAASTVFALTDILIAVSLPDTLYFGGSAHLQATTAPLRLGGNTEADGYFQGRIDEVRIYAHARTASEIRADMATAVALTPRGADLAAGYNFDEGSGSELIDVSGHGNTGWVRGATWTSEGRFRGALEFDGVSHVVEIPHSPWLNPTGAMTLEAWINPTAPQRGWRAVLQKEYDAYFLFANARAGTLRPGGGGTFGSSTETMAVPTPVPTNTWTHVAVTYDGAASQLYLNGSLVMRRLRWYPGRIVETAVDGLTIPAGLVTDSRQVRARLLAGAPVRVMAIVADPVSTRAPLVTLHDAARNEILLLAVEGDDVVFRLRTRAAAMELDSPPLRARGAMRGLVRGGDLTVTLSRTGATYCVEVNARSTCGLGFTLGTGWSFFLYSQIPPGWPHGVLNGLWMMALLLPFGFWFRRRWESLLGVAVMTATAVLVCILGHVSVAPAEIGAGLVGTLGGLLCSSLVAPVHEATGGTVQHLRG
jgi:glycopeptide antibiotics resistance protein